MVNAHWHPTDLDFTNDTLSQFPDSAVANYLHHSLLLAKTAQPGTDRHNQYMADARNALAALNRRLAQD